MQALVDTENLILKFKCQCKESRKVKNFFKYYLIGRQCGTGIRLDILIRGTEQNPETDHKDIVKIDFDKAIKVNQ